MTLPNPGPSIWSDEFPVAGAPNPANWGYDNWRDGQVYYTTSTHNAFVSGSGQLTIVVRRETPPDGLAAPYNYTSARITTRSRQEFVPPVRIQANIKCTFGTPAFPAFWMLGNNPNDPNNWPEEGELDLMELIPWSLPIFYPTTAHGPSVADPNVQTAAGYTWHSPVSLADAFHKYGIDWYADHIDFHIDNVVRHTVTRDAFVALGGDWTPFTGAWPLYLILDVAVLRADGTENFPQTMLVDWVRAWSLS